MLISTEQMYTQSIIERVENCFIILILSAEHRLYCCVKKNRVCQHPVLKALETIRHLPRIFTRSISPIFIICFSLAFLNIFSLYF